MHVPRKACQVLCLAVTYDSASVEKDAVEELIFDSICFLLTVK